MLFLHLYESQKLLAKLPVACFFCCLPSLNQCFQHTKREIQISSLYPSLFSMKTGSIN